jgi:hypothetical protein
MESSRIFALISIFHRTAVTPARSWGPLLKPVLNQIDLLIQEVPLPPGESRLGLDSFPVALP